MLKQFLCLIFLSAIVFSLNVTYDSSVDSDGSTVSLVRYYLNSSDSNFHSISVFGEIEDLAVFDGTAAPISFNSSYVDGWTIISFSIPFNYAELSFASNSQTSKNSSLWTYSSKTKISENLGSFDASLLLPSSSRLVSTNGEVSTKDSKIIIYWSSKDISSGSIINLKESHQLEKSNDSSFTFDPIYILVLVILISVSYFFWANNSKPKENAPSSPTVSSQPVDFSKLEQNSVYKTLDEIDKQLVREIYLRGGSTTQAQLNLNTQIPKATLSRRIASLESKGILQKSQKGIRNLISLTDLISS